MPMNGYNVGKDVVVDVIGPNGANVVWAGVSGFESKQMTSRNMIKRMDGVNIAQELPEGWDFTFSVDRADSSVDDYFAANEEAYYAGQNIGSGVVTETISEVSGGTTQYRYEGCVFKLDDAGDKTGDKNIKMKISGYASRRRKVQ